MKKQYFFCFIGLAFFFLHCQQKNQLAQDEASIAKELSDLEEIQEKPGNKKGPNITLSIPEESRKADPGHMPIVLDILAARADVRNLMLTDLYSKIRYILIRFKEPLDTLLNMQTRFEFTISPNNIFASNQAYGIIQFDRNGQYLNRIVRNDFHFTYYPKYNQIISMPEDRAQFVGSKQSIYTLNDKLYYQFDNAPHKIGAMMEYDASPGVLSATLVNQSELLPNTPKGGKLFEVDIAETKGKKWFESVKERIPIGQENWISTYGKMGSSISGSFLVSTTSSGDTITKFADHDPVKNFSGSTYRSLDGNGTQYLYKGIQHIRQPHNDTIYVIKEPNKLVPKYVFNFGDRGINNALEGIDPTFILQEKFIPEEFIETDDYLFIIYTQNSATLNNAKNGNAFYNACIYNKQTQELFHIYKDLPPQISRVNRGIYKPDSFLENNYDGGPAFWPQRTTEEGMPFCWFFAPDLKAKNDLWKDDEAMKNNINQMNDTDYLLMIAE